MKGFNPKLMIRNQINQMIQSNPQAQQAWNMAQQMSKNKTQDEKKQIVENLAKERGISLEQLKQMAQQYGIQI